MSRMTIPRLLLVPLATTVVAVAVLGVTAVSTPILAQPADGSVELVAATLTPAQETVAAMQPGWNLGNTFDATGADETSWGNPRVTEDLLDAVREQGFHSIRIPVTWGQHQGGAPDHVIDAAYLARVQQVVDWALADGFHVMINMHHDSWQWVTNMPAQHDAVLTRFTATWRQLAAAFRDEPEQLVFESINEQSFTGASGDAQSYSLLRELNTTFHQLVRGSGGNNATRLLVLPSLGTSPDQAPVDDLAATIAELDDPNLAATIHFYGYWPFSANIAGGTRFDATAQKDMADVFDRANQAFVSRGIPVIIGEYGLLGFDKNTGTIEQGEKLKFFEAFGNHARSTGITTMWWDNGQHLDRTAFRWRDPDLYQQIRSSWTERSGTASTDQLFVRRPADPAAQTVTLTPNGATLTGIAAGDAALVAGTDYTLDGDRLTVAASTLERLVGDGAYGVRAVLTATFSQGVPWRFQVISYDTPVLADASGTTGSFAIPTTFRGDQLATMEARYADGSNAGPQNWTSFKEFDRDFSPNVAANQITLSSTFFAEVRDGTVELRFHFWSGEILDYTLVRSGSTVTGSAG
jgi:aryl-phospho-beta-D-glucosidase BglC (GH1 family)